MTKDQEERSVRALETMAEQRSTLERQLGLIAGALETLSQQIATAAALLSSRP